MEDDNGRLTATGIMAVTRNIVPNPSAEDFVLREMAHGFAPGSIRDFTARMAEEMPDDAKRSDAFALGFILGLSVGYAQGAGDA